MIDEDRTYENEVRYYDRLVNRQDRKNIKIHIPLDLEGTGTQKVLQEKKIENG